MSHGQPPSASTKEKQWYKDVDLGFKTPAEAINGTFIANQQPSEPVSEIALFLMNFETVNILRKKHAGRFGDIYLYVSALAMFATITLHEVVDIVRAMQAFTGDESNPAYAGEYYSDIESAISVCKTAVYTVVTILSDAFIVFRTYVVWNQNPLVAILPTLLLIGDLGMGIAADHELTQLNVGTSKFNADAIARRTQAFYALTLTLNVICTLLIAYRIWSIQKELASVNTITSGRTSLTRIVNILIESCAVYSALLFILISTYAAGSPAMFIILDITAPIIGIVFFSVINRVGRGVSHGDHATSQMLTTLNFNSRSGMTPSTGNTVETATELHDMDSFHLDVTIKADPVGLDPTEKIMPTAMFMDKKPSLTGMDAV
ncbi:uncharacterized protein C8Q71DRAFT_854771 [Rhodofomes roseus]|uniref:Small ribosomal subunit protein uS17 N-terminal domain-containing protein n=1 Tax=Rhodofomes roseus TaxID=34475 RepID=A0ABQ8KQL4_9APHY|nr:uncharacterized protein C8Q71DRAFT_854771 [Rhodofomes roseus]KAH9840922.1 hypothetical protein C8Q71DRAFT_854771 [Rhodofomes roseus]